MSQSEPLFERVALIGLGLLGSSLALVAKRKGLAGHVAGSTRSALGLDLRDAEILGIVLVSERVGRRIDQRIRIGVVMTRGQPLTASIVVETEDDSCRGPSASHIDARLFE